MLTNRVYSISTWHCLGCRRSPCLNKKQTKKPPQNPNRMSLATPPSRVYHLLPSDSSLMLFVLCLHRLCCAGNLSHSAPNFWAKVPDTPCKCQCILKGTNPSSPSQSFIVRVCSSNQLYLIIGPLQNFVDHHYNPCCFENGHCCDVCMHVWFITANYWPGLCTTAYWWSVWTKIVFNSWLSVLTGCWLPAVLQTLQLLHY